MMMPSRIGGPKPAEKKPGVDLVVEVGKKIPERIGGPREEEAPSGEPEMMSNDKAKDEATREIISAVENKSESQLKSALEAFVCACCNEDSEPEGESASEQPSGAEE